MEECSDLFNLLRCYLKLGKIVDGVVVEGVDVVHKVDDGDQRGHNRDTGNGRNTGDEKIRRAHCAAANRWRRRRFYRPYPGYPHICQVVNTKPTYTR